MGLVGITATLAYLGVAACYAHSAGHDVEHAIIAIMYLVISIAHFLEHRPHRD
jgi:hypothetical protein